ncbi:hypothetical protein RRG08_043102 [Elysia crispata]|uniref:Uncharacterized protein n=1 Tax=Elysia crispata TaxID=231223 RepID=A0AAE0XY58_9GAST|nr:hypothetical protein RRG08_043102 [Elysia crispata]
MKNGETEIQRTIQSMGRVAADMGCTPSIHVSHTGVVYCRDNEEAATSSPQGTLSASGTASATTATAVHVSTRGGPGRSSGRGHKDKQLAVMSSTAAAVTTSSHGGHGDPALATGSVDSAADAGCRRGDGGRLSVTLSEAETQTSRQSMKCKALIDCLTSTNCSAASGLPFTHCRLSFPCKVPSDINSFYYPSK